MKCVDPNCTGTYDADGYCDECGKKQPGTASAGATPAASPVTGSTPSVPTPTSPSISGRTAGGLGGYSTGTTGSTRSRAARRGGELYSMPPVPLRDPATAIMKNPSVPESQRYCSKCGEPIGRGRDGQPGRTEGFCPRDRVPFSFTPRLTPGDRVSGRYEILGALAHGGLGWIYLARDRNISESGADRWVVLKGLINTGDQDALDAAMAERRFLVELDHPDIVKIYDIVEHPDARTGEMIGYIVMEYVGGESLKQRALANRDATGKRVPLPLEQVFDYMVRVLDAIGYIHERGLLFCDFKPDNVIHYERRLKVIDLGAVRRIDDHVSPLWGTPGYQAPELAQVGASISSDLYTIGRTIAVLSFDFSGFSTKYADSLPGIDDIALFKQHETFYRLLKRATNKDWTKRFPSAADMAEQIKGVADEVASSFDGQPRTNQSGQFTPEHRAFGTRVDAEPLTGAEVAMSLPLPLVDPMDPAAGFLATLNTADINATINALRGAPDQTIEVKLQLIRAYLEAGDVNSAFQTLGDLPSDGDWRRDWSEGLIALAAGQPAGAVQAFDRVFDALPGEPAAQLALAAANELGGERAWADWRYQRVWKVDHTFVSAAFGVARMRLAAGDRAGAVVVLDEVPTLSSHHTAAQIAAVRAGLNAGGKPLESHDFTESSRRLEQLKLDTERQARLAVEMFNAALAWLGAVAPSPRQSPAVTSTGRLLGQALTERDVRFGLERAYRVLAAQESDPAARYQLVDQANAVRPRTLV